MGFLVQRGLLCQPGRVEKGLVDDGGHSREYGAVFPRMVAHGDDVIRSYVLEIVYVVVWLDISTLFSAMATTARRSTPWG